MIAVHRIIYVSNINIIKYGFESNSNIILILYVFQTGTLELNQNSQNYSCFIDSIESWVVCMEKGKFMVVVCS